MATYPAGVLVAPVRLAVAGSDGRSLGGRWQIRASRPLMWAATRQPVLTRPLTRTLAGVPVLTDSLPVTGQAGFVDPVTRQPIAAWSYLVTYQPLTDSLMSATITVPAAGVRVDVAAALDVVFWPHATQVVIGDGSNPGTWTEPFPGVWVYTE